VSSQNETIKLMVCEETDHGMRVLDFELTTVPIAIGTASPPVFGQVFLPLAILEMAKKI
jgi:hypothetical protein